MNGTFKYNVNNYGTIKNGSFTHFVNNLGGEIIYGVFDCEVVNLTISLDDNGAGSYIDGKIIDGIFNRKVSNHGGIIIDGTFNGSFEATTGNILGGIFNYNTTITGAANVEGGIFNYPTDLIGGSVTNGGMFKKDVKCEEAATISGGTFKGEVTLIDGTRITGGIFDNTVTLKGGGTAINGGTFNKRVNAYYSAEIYGNSSVTPTLNGEIYVEGVSSISQPCEYGPEATVVEGSNQRIGVIAYQDGQKIFGTYGFLLGKSNYLKSKDGISDWTRVTRTDKYTLQPLYLKKVNGYNITLNLGVEGTSQVTVFCEDSTYTLPDAGLFLTNPSSSPKFLGWAYGGESEIITTSSIPVSGNINLKALWGSGSIYEITETVDLTDIDLTEYDQIWIKDTGEITGGTIDIPVYNEGVISGGTYSRCVDNIGTITDGTFLSIVNIPTPTSIIEDGTFENNVTGYGIISNGTFNGEVLIKGNAQIENGIFNSYATLQDSSKALGGTFNGAVYSYSGSRILGGTFNEELYIKEGASTSDGTFNGRVYVYNGRIN